jgi:monofunctional biosynthetic peptidoglycan transglycosylase
VTRRKRRSPSGLLVTVALTGAALVLFWLGYKILTWPDVAALAEVNPKSTAFIERYEATRSKGKQRSARWTWVSWGAISPHLKRAAVVAEDMEFFSHDGFSRREIKAAIEKAMEEKELPRGASTITQQLAKNLWLSPSRSPLRKVEEAILTRQLEKNLTKRRILELYLNIAEFGPGVYGAEAAARTYFGKSAASLSANEAASLVAGLPRPSKWHPGSGSRTYARRTGRIERMMARAGYLARYVGGGSAPPPAGSSDAVPPRPAVQPTEVARADAGSHPTPILAPADTVDLEQMMEDLKRDLAELQREEALAEIEDEGSNGAGADSIR